MARVYQPATRSLAGLTRVGNRSTFKRKREENMRELLWNLLDRYRNVCTFKRHYADFLINFRRNPNTDSFKKELNIFWEELSSNMMIFGLNYEQISLFIYDNINNKKIDMGCYQISDKLVEINGKLYVDLYTNICCEIDGLYIPEFPDLNRLFMASSIPETILLFELYGGIIANRPPTEYREETLCNKYAYTSIEVYIPTEYIASIEFKDVLGE